MAWDDIEFVEHYYYGNGANKTLDEIGLLSAVKSESSKLAIDRTDGFKEQIRSEARRVKEGDVNIKFENSYSFSSVKFSMGSGVLRGNFVGKGTLVLEGKIFVSGTIVVEYTDAFTDPLSVIEFLYGSSNSPDAPDWLKKIGELGGTAYKITGSWEEKFSSDVILLS